MAHNSARDPKTFTSNNFVSTDSITSQNEAWATDPSDLLTEREAFLQEQNQCCLCGHELSFDHVVDFTQLTVIESASCDPCKIQLRKRLFTLN